jgi:hypothetical protein
VISVRCSSKVSVAAVALVGTANASSLEVVSWTCSVVPSASFCDEVLVHSSVAVVSVTAPVVVVTRTTEVVCSVAVLMLSVVAKAISSVAVRSPGVELGIKSVVVV